MRALQASSRPKPGLGTESPGAGKSPVADPKRLKPAGKPRRTLRVTTVGLGVLATLLLFGLVGFQAVIVSSQGDIDDLDSQLDSAVRTNQRLRLDVAELESPERIRGIALSNLGMIEPLVVEYLEPISAEELAPTERSAG